MSAHVLLNQLEGLGKSENNARLAKHLIIFLHHI